MRRVLTGVVVGLVCMFALFLAGGGGEPPNAMADRWLRSARLGNGMAYDAYVERWPPSCDNVTIESNRLVPLCMEDTRMEWSRDPEAVRIWHLVFHDGSVVASRWYPAEVGDGLRLWSWSVSGVSGR